MPLVFLQIRYLLKCFKPLNLLVQSTTFSFGNFFHIQYKTNVKKKLKRKAKWETEIDLQETKTEQSQRLWRTETNVQNSIKRWCYNYMYIDFYWFYASLWYCICSVLWLGPLSSWKCFEWPFPREGCTSMIYSKNVCALKVQEQIKQN